MAAYSYTVYCDGCEIVHGVAPDIYWASRRAQETIAILRDDDFGGFEYTFHIERREISEREG